ncbi:hypothetical protein [Pseudonocardia sp. ICBG1034]|uniref:hypothetical protein n=1 Tax=Pseudonocardia sp. ICBG1034 TaxID=2844381 RepID=UPI001CCF7A9E|nr:hypothetical protein [Pseudonocardia sp. ICBG1034]
MQRGELTAGVEDGVHPRGAERAQQLVLQVGVAHPDRHRRPGGPAAGRRGPGVAQHGDPVRGGGGEGRQGGAQVGVAVQDDDRHVAGRGAATSREGLEHRGVAGPLDGHHRGRGHDPAVTVRPS